MIPLLHLNLPAERRRIERLLDDLRLSPISAVLEDGIRAEQLKTELEPTRRPATQPAAGKSATTHPAAGAENSSAR